MSATLLQSGTHLRLILVGMSFVSSFAQADQVLHCAASTVLLGDRVFICASPDGQVAPGCGTTGDMEFSLESLQKNSVSYYASWQPGDGRVEINRETGQFSWYQKENNGVEWRRVGTCKLKETHPKF